MQGNNTRGRGRRGGAGFGFRSSAPPWPYTGRGRGGLPRCSYYLNNPVNVPAEQTATTVPDITREQEKEYLRNQAANLKKQLETVESRLGKIDGIK
jgi:hypothetical protein